MALDVPFDAIIQAKQRGAQNRQQMMQGFGQTLADLGATGGDILKKRAEAMKKQKQQKDLFAQLSQIPELQKFAGPMSSDPALIGQLGPGLLKTQKPSPEYSVVPGEMSPEGEPLIINRFSGDIRPSGPKGAKVTSSGATLGTVREEGVRESLNKDARDVLNVYFQSGPGKDQGDRLNSISRIEPLIEQMQSQADSGDTRQMRETATTLNRIIQGTTGSEAQIEGLIPNTAKGKYANWVEYLTNAPKGAGQSQFIKRYADSVSREKKAINNRIDMQIRANAPTLRQLKQQYPGDYDAQVEAVIKQFGSSQLSPAPAAPGAPSPRTPEQSGKATLRWNPQTNSLDPVP